MKNLLESFEELLLNLTALEVNTMIVANITADKFIPWEAYRDIYIISQEYLYQQNIHPALQEQYLHIRNKLESEYVVLLMDSSSDLYQADFLKEAQEYYARGHEVAIEIEKMGKSLPNPLDWTENSEDNISLTVLLSNNHFLRSLRKLSEIKSTLDNRNRAAWELANQQQSGQSIELSAVKTDLIYAQTTMQLDGEVINRYAQEILDHPHREVIIDIHQKSVNYSQKQWQSIIKFIVDFLKLPF